MIQPKELIQHAMPGLGALGGLPLRYNAKTYFVDGTHGSDAASGIAPNRAKKTIQAAVTAAPAWSRIYVYPRTIADYTGDPTSYDETIIIPYTKQGLQIIGVGTGRTQGGLPQIKKGSGAVALLTVRAPGCGIYNIGFNASGSTGGCILLDDDYAAKAAFGTTIHNCHFKNSVNATAATSGGAISWSAQGNAWQVTISDCQFYRNVCDICIIGTASTVPQDVVIKNCTFSSDAAIADCNIYAGGNGFGGGLIIDNCLFPKQPAKGTTDRFTVITCYGTAGTGIMSNCRFGAAGTTTGYGASKATANIGTTIELCGNYSNAGLIVRET
jgi:hypothetical protein